MKILYERYAKKWKHEIVERKGVGHPDSIADGIAENFSINLSKYYLDNFGNILHHNVDKLQVVAGNSIPKFGGGKVTKPITIFFSGRATDRVGKKKIPIKEIAKKSAYEFFERNFRYVKKKHLRFIVETKGGAGNLKDIFKRRGIPSNDTSVGIGFSPLTRLEKNILEIEKVLTKYRSRMKLIGEDVKVMGIRINSKFFYTVAVAFVDKFVNSEDDYFEKKQKLIDLLTKKFDGINLNTLDRKGRGINGLYLTVTGTSLESGDDGAVGRGNRVEGIIPFNRFYSLEAVAGKNPVNHVGKIYNVVAKMIANDIYERYGVENYVWIVSQIGRDVRDPWIVKIAARKRYNFKSVVEENLNRIPDLTKKFVRGELRLF